MSVCVFCERDTKLTVEDVIPQWAGDLFPGEGPWRNRSTRYRQPHVDYRSKDFRGMKVRGPCADCNNGWMSQLEGRVKYDLTPMILGQRRVYLSTDRQADIAAWMCKITMMLEYAGDGNREHFFTQEERNYLRQNALPPSGVAVALGRYTGDQHMWIHGFDVVATSKGDGEVGDATKGAMSIGQLFAYAFSKRTVSGKTEYPFRRSLADAYLVQIWPVVGHVAEWPPPAGLSTALRDELTGADEEEDIHPRSLNRPAKYMPSRITASRE